MGNNLFHQTAPGIAAAMQSPVVSTTLALTAFLVIASWLLTRQLEKSKAVWRLSSKD